MVSLRSVPLPAAINLEPDLKRRASPPDKSLGVSYVREPKSSRLDGGVEPIKPLEIHKALSLLGEGGKIEPSYYRPLLEHCIKTKPVRETEMVHAHMIKTGTHEDVYEMTSLVNVYSKSGFVGHARKAFDCLPRRNLVAWTTLMAGYVQESRPELAIDVFVEMLESGSFPSDVTLGTLVKACTSLNSVKLGKQIHGYVMKYGTDHITYIGNALCSLYLKFGSLDSMLKAFSKIEEKNDVSWTGVITACGDRGEIRKGLRYFIMMLDDVEPNCFNIANVLSLCCAVQYLELGKQIYSLSIKLGCGSNSHVKNSMMYLYLKCGRIDEGRSFFDGEEFLNLITCTSMIAGLAKAMLLAKDDVSARNRGVDALHIYMKLNRSGTKPDLFTLSSVLTVCDRLAALEQGEQIHSQVIKSGFFSDAVVGTALVNMYKECGSVNRASKAFLEMPIRTFKSWTTMIHSFALHGWPQKALQLFEDMRLAGVRPDVVTFICVLSACSHAGLVDEALEYFEMMQKQYKIRPGLDHYECLVDMFVRLGRLDEAFDIAKRIDLEPKEVIWMLLISGCRTHGNQDMGFFAAEQLLNLKPKDTETYETLLNIYIPAERQQDVAEVRKLMKEKNVGILDDWSWINIKGKTFSFRSNDQLHPQSAATDESLEELLEKAKGFRYRCSEDAELIDDVEEDAQENRTLSSGVHHSEKLAVAFGLLNVHKDAPIRIFKSKTMCKDSHDFIKATSMAQSRKIIIRDRRRLHIFHNGICSCADTGSLL